MDRSDDPRAALVRLRGVYLLPAVLCRRCCGAGGCLIPEDAKHRRPTAGHQSRHSDLFTQQSLDGPGVLGTAAFFQCIAGSGAHRIQISGADGGFLGLTSLSAFSYLSYPFFSPKTKTL